MGVYIYANTLWNVHTTRSDMIRVEVREVIGGKQKTRTWVGSSWNYVEIFIIVISSSPAGKEQCWSSLSAALWVQMLPIFILSKRHVVELHRLTIENISEMSLRLQEHNLDDSTANTSDGHLTAVGTA